MRAIAVVPGTKTIRMVERPRPSIGAPDEIELRVLRVGICGTDREEAAGGRAKAPPGHDDLVLGHEMIGQVTAVGAVTMQQHHELLRWLAGFGRQHRPRKRDGHSAIPPALRITTA